jgi:hypothetical protein
VIVPVDEAPPITDDGDIPSETEMGLTVKVWLTVAPPFDAPIEALVTVVTADVVIENV